MADQHHTVRDVPLDLDAEYNNRARVPEFADIVAQWKIDAEVFRQAAAGEIGIAYGDDPRQTYDLFHTKDDAGGPIVAFIHGGYWRSLDKEHFSHLARGLSLHGIPVAMAEYRLCPSVTMADIITDIVQFAIHLHRHTSRRIVACGHSAGGHLAACLTAADWGANGMPDDLVCAGMGISGLYDLRPLIATEINTSLNLDDAQAREASPLLWPSPKGRRFEAWVGGIESDEFRRQSLTLAATWKGAGARVHYRELNGANHFNVIDSLGQPTGALTQALVALARGT